MQFKRIIAAIDPEDDLAEKVLAAAHSLALRDGAALAVVSVWPRVSASPLGVGGDAGAGAAAASQAVLEQHRLGREACDDRLNALIAATAPEAEVVILDGDAAEETTQYAEKMGADLIVTGSHQRGFWGALLHGSSSRGLVHDAPCAVFIVTKRCSEAI